MRLGSWGRAAQHTGAMIEKLPPSSSRRKYHANIFAKFINIFVLSGNCSMFMFSDPGNEFIDSSVGIDMPRHC